MIENGFPPPPAEHRISYDEAKQLAASPMVENRLYVAYSPFAPPEVLMLLSRDGDAYVRGAVAFNPRTPSQAWLGLARDKEEPVRRQLAERLGKGLEAAGEDVPGERTQQRAVEAMNILARDPVPRVRLGLARHLCEREDAPIEPLRILAADAVSGIAQLVLERGALPDVVLVDLAERDATGRAASYLAGRGELTEEVVDAIVAGKNQQAVMKLLRNPRARLRQTTLDRLIEVAASDATLLEPLTQRPELSERAARRLAQVLPPDLLHKLAKRPDLPPRLVQDLREMADKKSVPPPKPPVKGKR